MRRLLRLHRPRAVHLARPQLWHRFTIGLRRGVTARLPQLGEDPTSVRVSYVKVVELQRRAVPHFHAVVRLDAAADPDRPPAPPDTALGADDLAAIVAHTATAVRLNVAGPTGTVAVAFGSQSDVQALRATPTCTAGGANDLGAEAMPARRVAAYLAKYVTKSVAEFGLGARRISERAIPELRVTDHVRRILSTIADLAELPGHRAMVAWLHTLGYRGHITSKTRKYSTTMGALLARREAWRQEHQAKTPTGANADNAHLVDADSSEWQFAGFGHTSAGDRLLALTAATRAAEACHVARDEIAEGGDDGPT